MGKPKVYRCPSCGEVLDFGVISHHFYCDDEKLEFSEEYLKGYWDCFEKLIHGPLVDEGALNGYWDQLSRDTLEKVRKEVEGELE